MRHDRRAIVNLSPEGKFTRRWGYLCGKCARPRGASRRQVALTVDNPWGRFLFEAEPLAPAGNGAMSAIHVSIEQHEPREVAWRRPLERFSLSVAQREVVTLLRAGYTQTEIAAALCIAPSTVADHVRKIYAKLDTHSVRELCARLDECG